MEGDAAGGVDDSDIAPGSLRVNASVGEEMFGALYTGIQT